MIAAHCIYIPISYTSQVFVHITMLRNNLHKETPFKGIKNRGHDGMQLLLIQGAFLERWDKASTSLTKLSRITILWLLEFKHSYSKCRCLPVLRRSSHCQKFSNGTRVVGKVLYHIRKSWSYRCCSRYRTPYVSELILLSMYCTGVKNAFGAGSVVSSWIQKRNEPSWYLALSQASFIHLSILITARKGQLCALTERPRWSFRELK